MVDFLTAVKSARVEADRQTATSNLTEISTESAHSSETQHASATSAKALLPVESRNSDSPKDALLALKALPQHDDLICTLRKLKHGFPNHDFSLSTPGPLQAQIISALVGLILPSFWSVLESNDRTLLLDCLRSVAGVNAVVSRLQLLADKASQTTPEELGNLLAVARELFRPDDLVFRVWTELPSSSFAAGSSAINTKNQLAWKEFVRVIASGRVVTAFARAEDVLKARGEPFKTSWQANGADFAAWLGRNVAQCVVQSPDATILSSTEASVQLFARALSLGYPLPLIRDFLTAVVVTIRGPKDGEEGWLSFVKILPAHTKRQLLETAVRWLASMVEDDVGGDVASLEAWAGASPITAAFSFLVQSDRVVGEQLLTFLQDPVLLSSVGFCIRRASIAVVAIHFPDELEALLKRLMMTFGDPLFINHAPSVQQDGVAQTLLLVAGYLYRKTPAVVTATARSSSHMQGVSNRLDSTNQRARWLGMVVGTAVSSLVDKEGSKMTFGTEEMQSDEADWYKKTITVSDSIGELPELCQFLKDRQEAPRAAKRSKVSFKREMLPVINGKQTFGPPRPPQTVQTEVIGEKVTELSDDEEHEIEQFRPYAKPDSDAEDSDEDATLVNRNKPRPPVYIRDLMRMLRDDKDHDRFQIAIAHAPGLIRRKANSGGEVRDHAEELAVMLCDLQDPFDTDDFDELRLQALIAVLLSNVRTIAPWLSRQAFGGDYGLAQRCVMLSALGLGGRELAGLKDTDDLNPSRLAGFPSQLLPDKLHALYSPSGTSTKRLHAASESIQHQLMKPLALSAADEATSHLSAVKVRTFSSRMNVERTRRRVTGNNLSKILGESFFYPLATRYQQEVAAYGASSVFISAPFVLVTFIKTLALLLHASGPATTDLPDITTAFWDMMLSLRMQAASDMSILEAVLFSFLTLLEVNAGAVERLARENSSQMILTQQWVEVVFEKMSSGALGADSSKDEDRVRALAAGVLVKMAEVVEARQKVLMGAF